MELIFIIFLGLIFMFGRFTAGQSMVDERIKESVVMKKPLCLSMKTEIKCYELKEVEVVK